MGRTGVDKKEALRGLAEKVWAQGGLGTSGGDRGGEREVGRVAGP